jgi:hypothetical protein
MSLRQVAGFAGLPEEAIEALDEDLRQIRE